MALSMLGMIVIAPAIGVWLAPIFEGIYNVFGIDPSVIPASLLANDMGGMSIAQSVCVSDAIGGYNAFVVSSMMGCTISFTLPCSRERTVSISARIRWFFRDFVTRLKRQRSSSPV